MSIGEYFRPIPRLIVREVRGVEFHVQSTWPSARPLEGGVTPYEYRTHSGDLHVDTPTTI